MTATTNTITEALMNTATVPSESRLALGALATKINKAHFACEAAIKSALQHARRCGDRLRDAKRALGHGNFENWIEKNCRFSSRMARKYMVVSRGWQRLMDLAKRNRGSETALESLSVKEALRILTAGGPEEVDSWRFIEKTCPSCGEPLAMTSVLYATCVCCFDCRLHRHGFCPSAAERSLEIADRVESSFGKIEFPQVQADVIVSLLGKLDDGVMAEVKAILARGAHGKAAEKIGSLAAR